MKNKVGERYGKLVVLEKTEKRDKHGYCMYICRCDCGTIKEISSAVLTPSGLKSCGCLLAEAKEKHKLKLVGQQFGDLYVVDQMPSQTNYTMWKCKCICGNEIVVRGNNLTYGDTKNCGCKNAKRMKTVNYKNLCGKVFGELKVIEETDKRSPNGNVVWKCICACGKEALVDSGSLQSGNTKSCGCLQSQGELKIRKILEDNNIPFQQQYSFDDCRDKNPLPFDFYVDNKYLIEYDGIHHFFATNGWNTIDRVKATQIHDKIKNKYCLKNNIPLIRIPYTHYGNICLNDLSLSTSNFLISSEKNNDGEGI